MSRGRRFSKIEAVIGIIIFLMASWVSKALAATEDLRQLVDKISTHLNSQRQQNVPLNLPSCMDQEEFELALTKNTQGGPYPLIELLRENTLGLWMSMKEAINKNPNTPFPLFNETFEDMEREILKWFKVIETDEFSGLDGKTRADFKEVLRLSLHGIKGLRVRMFPYQESLRFVSKYIQVVDFLRYKVKYDPIITNRMAKLKRALKRKIKAQDINEKTKTFKMSMLMAMKKNEPLTPAHINQALTQLHREKHPNDKNVVELLPYPASADVLSLYASPSLEISLVNPYFKDIIIIPSFAPLDFKFFYQTRTAPVYVLGMISDEMAADGIYQGPQSFFNHDQFHARQLQQTFEEYLIKMKSAHAKLTLSDEDVYQRQHDVGKLVEGDLERLLHNEDSSIEDKQMALAADILLFTLMHEPVEGKAKGGFNSECVYPAVFDHQSVGLRLDPKKCHDQGGRSFLDYLKQRIADGEYGKVTDQVVAKLEDAGEWIIKRLRRAERKHPWSHYGHP